MLLTEFTTKMLLNSCHGNMLVAINLADKLEKFYEPFSNKNKIANSRCRSAQKCFFELFDMQTDEVRRK